MKELPEQRKSLSYQNNETLFKGSLTFYMCKCTERSSGTVSSLPHVVAFGGFVDLRKEEKIIPSHLILIIVVFE